MKPRFYLTALTIMLTISLGMPSLTMAHPHHRPQWVTFHSCDVATRYVFFPEQDLYYDMVREVYIYPSHGTWVYSEIIPTVFAHIDLAFVPIIELDIVVERPFIYHSDHILWYNTYNYDYDYVRYYRGHGHHGHYAHYHAAPRHGHYGYYERHDHDRDSRYGHRDYDRGGNRNYRPDNDNRGNYGHSGNGNNKGSHSNGKGNYKKQENKSSRDYGHRGDGSGNGRQSNGRGR